MNVTNAYGHWSCKVLASAVNHVGIEFAEVSTGKSVRGRKIL